MKPAPLKWNRGNPSLARQAGYWLLWTVPVLMLAGHFGWQTWHRARRENVSQRRSQAAARKARQSLRQAGSLAQQDPARAYNAAGQILTGYIADKLSRSITGLTQDGLGDVLISQGVEPELVERLLSCLMLSEMGWYSPAVSTMSTNDILAETERLITDLEKAF
jgi:hypothetical protein